MQCASCHQQTPGIVDSNHLWCDQCGCSMADNYQLQHVSTFSNPHSASRKQIYCRVKRFAKFVPTVCKDVEVLRNLQEILDLYSALEFTWIVEKEIKQRIYFFASKVMLQACCQILKIKPINLPSLKDTASEDDQHRQIEKLRKTKTWKILYHSDCCDFLTRKLRNLGLVETKRKITP